MSSLMNVLTIAGQTFTEARRNRVFYSLFLFALVVVLSSIIFTEVTTTTMDRVLKDTGLAAINIFALALTIFAGVGIINREIDRRSIYTVLAKPVSRFSYILGKWLGLVSIILATSTLMFVGLLVVMKIYKTDIHAGIFSAFICAAVYFSGHLSTEFLRVVRKSQGPRRVIGEAVYYLVPNLERFNFKYHATYDVTVASTTLLAVVLFGLAYAGAALLGAVIVFQRRDFR